jgi:hypothetical protein
MCATRAFKVLLLTATPFMNRESDIINLISMIDGIPITKAPKLNFFKKNILANESSFAKYFACKISIQYNKKTDPDFPDIKIMPLKLAYALSIHKSQGMTLDKVYIDIGNDIFESGQTYVALSRVKTLDGLFLKNLDISKITINKKVKMFYTNLELNHKEGLIEE